MLWDLEESGRKGGVDMIKICCISIRNAQRINTNIILKKTKLKYDKCGESTLSDPICIADRDVNWPYGKQ